MRVYAESGGPLHELHMNSVKSVFFSSQKICEYVIFLGKDNFGFGFGGTGKKSYSSQFDDYGEVL